MGLLRNSIGEDMWILKGVKMKTAVVRGSMLSPPLVPCHPCLTWGHCSGPDAGIFLLYKWDNWGTERVNHLLSYPASHGRVQTQKLVWVTAACGVLSTASESPSAFMEQVCLSEGPAQGGGQARVRQRYRAQEWHDGQVATVSPWVQALSLPGLGAFTFSKVLLSAQQQFKELAPECPIWPRFLAFPESLEGQKRENEAPGRQ